MYKDLIKRNLWKKMIQFKGRMSRREFWIFTTSLIVPLTALQLIIIAQTFQTTATQINKGQEINAFALTPIQITAGSITFIVLLMALPALLSATSRRLQDINITPLMLIPGLCIPILGPVVLIIFLCLAGTPGNNRFGPPNPVE